MNVFAFFSEEVVQMMRFEEDERTEISSKFQTLHIKKPYIRTQKSQSRG